MIHLNKVSILIKTFLRDEMLFKTIKGIRGKMPAAQLIIADDGNMSSEKSRLYDELKLEGHKIIIMPFDSGFGAKSNAGMKVFQNEGKRDFLLIGSDDFDFHPTSARDGILNLVDVMLCDPSVDIASGRVNGHPYEFYLEIAGNADIGYQIKEHNIWDRRVPVSSFEPWFVECDLTVNYSLIRKRVFDKVWWENDVKIGGGEHGAFFFDCKMAGFKIVYVPGVNIYEQQAKEVNHEYWRYRCRARSPERPCFDKRRIRKYILGNGQIDYENLHNLGHAL